MSKQENRKMKDGLGAAAIERMVLALSKAMPEFDQSNFIRQAEAGIEDLELKERVNFLIELLHNYLPSDFPGTAVILITAKEHWDNGNGDDPLHGFAAWPLIDYVGTYGLDHPEESLHVLGELTSLFSSEMAIRPFILNHFDKTYEQLKIWCDHPDEHVRRLVSEGIRPRLPWATQLKPFLVDPEPIIALLSLLKDDNSRYVQRSVANNLNDIAKDHPDRVIEVCKDWMDGSQTREWIVRHATRTLVKKGHPEVFSLLGFADSPRITINNFQLTSRHIQLGDILEFSFCLKSQSDERQRLVVDYAIHHLKANGSLSPKVFKLKNINLDALASINIDKRHPIKLITTRKYHQGEHLLEVLINGESYSKTAFILND